MARNERGSELVELALLLPLLALLLGGAVDLGLGIRTAIVLQNASREGARYWSLHPADRAGAVSRVDSELAFAGLAGLGSGTTTVTLFPASGSPTAGTELSVRLTHSYATRFASLVGVTTIPLRAETHMDTLY